MNRWCVANSVQFWIILFILSQAFAEAAKQTAECFQKDQAPFVVKNRLGLPVAVLYSEVLKPIGKKSNDRVVELQDGESLNMDYTLTAADADQFSAMTSLSSKNYIQPSKFNVFCRSLSLTKTSRIAVINVRSFTSLCFIVSVEALKTKKCSFLFITVFFS